MASRRYERDKYAGPSGRYDYDWDAVPPGRYQRDPYPRQAYGRVPAQRHPAPNTCQTNWGLGYYDTRPPLYSQNGRFYVDYDNSDSSSQYGDGHCPHLQQKQVVNQAQQRAAPAVLPQSKNNNQTNRVVAQRPAVILPQPESDFNQEPEVAVQLTRLRLKYAQKFQRAALKLKQNRKQDQNNQPKQVHYSQTSSAALQPVSLNIVPKIQGVAPRPPESLELEQTTSRGRRSDYHSEI